MSIFEGARATAMYAKIAQRNGLVPIIGTVQWTRPNRRYSAMDHGPNRRYSEQINK